MAEETMNRLQSFRKDASVDKGLFIVYEGFWYEAGEPV